MNKKMTKINGSNIMKWFFVVFMFISFNTFAENKVKIIRSNSLNSKIQVVLDTTEAPLFKAFSLSNPSRIVIDILGTASKDYVNKLDFNNRGITRLRTGLRSDKEARIVIDLRENYQWSVYAIKPSAGKGHRVVIDVFDKAVPIRLDSLTDTEEMVTNIKQPASPIKIELETGKEEKQPSQIIASTVKPIAKEIKPVETIKPVKPKIIKPVGVIKPVKPKVIKQVETIKPVKPKIIKPPKKTAPETIVKVQPKAEDFKRRTSSREILIMIDPGHGGKDSGARGPSRSKEKEIVLQISKRLKRKIDRMPGMRAILTRSSDRYISLRGRLRIARKSKADLFISIHADAFTKASAKGSSVFILSNRGATSEAARWLAKRENSVDLKYGVDIGDYDRDISDILVKIQQDVTIESSYLLARKTIGEIGKIGTLHKRYVERAGFAVLKSPDIPSILVETGFISNPYEEKRLMSSSYQDKLATKIAKGIEKYFDEHLPHHMLLIESPGI